MIAKYQEELAKFNLSYIVTSEFENRYRGVILKDNSLILEKWVMYKGLAPSRIKDFALLTKQNVDTHINLMRLLGGFRG